MEMLNDSQNEMEFKDDSRSTISPISTSSIDTSSTCERKLKIESNIQVYTSVRQVTKRELAQNFSINNDYEHPEYKSLKNSIRLFTKELKRLEGFSSVVLCSGVLTSSVFMECGSWKRISVSFNGKHGFNLSIETFLTLPWISISKYLSFLALTAYGPRKTGYSEELITLL
ncbi:hypothetical protein NPIL_562351 [Nephila pilipes]|uniref:Uncharacterized protein n=1 Tax=Nephila pilipes TaxID=299642 RepID=A0A8X6TJC4_NEPPI|nr:hypothetical protein NPIL_562351 [Nephila pilipes]